jgi:hypothetical protein
MLASERSRWTFCCSGLDSVYLTDAPAIGLSAYHGKLYGESPES